MMWKKLGAMLLCTILFGCGGGGDGTESGPSGTTPPQEETTQRLTLQLTDANSQVPINGVSLMISGESRTTNAQGSAYYDLEPGTYIVLATKSGYVSEQKSVELGESDQTVSIALEQDVDEPVPEEMYVFHSEHDDSYYMEFWGDDWGSGATISNQVVDENFSKVLELSSGTNWGKGAGIAWGNEQANSIDASMYNYARFNLKSNGFEKVEVHVQGFNIPNFSITLLTSSGTALADGWKQFEVAIPATTQLRWFALTFPSEVEASVLISDISLINKTVQKSEPSVSAPTPTVSDADVFSIYSDSLNEDKFVSLWNENWWNAPFYSEESMNGDHYARYEIVGEGSQGGVTGIQFGIEYGSVDVSHHDTWNVDLYIESGISKVVLQLVSTDGSATYALDNPQTGQWLSLAIPFSDMTLNGNAALNTAQLQMAGIQLWGAETKAIFVDNFYFSGTSNQYDINVLVKDEQGLPLASADVLVGVSGDFDEPYTVKTSDSGIAVLTLTQGTQKIKALADGYGITQVLTVIGSVNDLTLSLTPLASQPNMAAPIPTVANEDVIALFSDSLSSPHYVTYWSDAWWNPPVHSMISILGNQTSKFQITPDGVAGGTTGIQYGVEPASPVDASQMTGLRFDFYATSGVTQAQFQLLSESGPLLLMMENITTEEWISVELSFDALGAVSQYDKTKMTQLGMALWGTTSDSVYLDNLYFY
ncbi:carboxypeptidase regulatory-like domain-containing protein [Vibrio sp. 10N.286.49.B1]|uniref:hypothetical protein n=1 Tax=unclassified Vibrio TaxID=2614977 RepID=UPI000C85BD06|nr:MULTISPECIES: hypothetical protein [unclassified Vibrio]